MRPGRSDSVPVRSFERTIAAKADELPRLMEELEAFAAEAGLMPLATSRLMLLVEEATVNVVTHGGSGPQPATYLRILISAGAEGISLTIEDDSAPYDVTQHAAPDIDARLDQRNPGGLGVHLLKTLSARLGYCRDGRLNRLSCLVKAE
jgi:serine/threonine-protein kinase RsbW